MKREIKDRPGGVSIIQQSQHEGLLVWGRDDDGREKA
jgi:hypothetical protein